MLDDVMRDMKIAVVDMAAQMKEVRERLSALEENRKIDLAQMNEKWNSHQRKIAKLERMVTGVVKQNERISSSII